MKPVLVPTEYRGVFAGLIEDDQDIDARSMTLQECRMAIYWGVTRGVMELAATGPTENSLISLPATARLHGITAVFDITPEAWERWQNA